MQDRAANKQKQLIKRTDAGCNNVKDGNGHQRAICVARSGSKWDFNADRKAYKCILLSLHTNEYPKFTTTEK